MKRKNKRDKTVTSPEELETIEIMADSKLIKSLIRAETDTKSGKLHSHKDVFGV